MKNISRIIAVLFVLCTVGLFTACSEPDAVYRGKIPAGQGTVYMTLSGTGARTVFPVGYEGLDVTVTATSSAETPVTGTFDEEGFAAINLKAGIEWALNISAKNAGTEVGTAGPLTVTPVNQQITRFDDVFIVPKTGADGTLNWAVTFPSGVYVSATLEIDGQSSIDLTTKASEALAIAPGSYKVVAKLQRVADGKVAGKSQAVHIYTGMTTNLTYVFTDVDFKSEAEYFAEDLRDDIGTNAAIGLDKVTVTVTGSTTITDIHPTFIARRITVGAGVTLVVDTGATLTIDQHVQINIDKDSDVILKGDLVIKSGGTIELNTWDPVQFENFLSEGTGKLVLFEGSTFNIAEWPTGATSPNWYVYIGESNYSYAMWRLTHESGFVEISKLDGAYPIFKLNGGIETREYGAVILPMHKFIVQNGSALDIKQITATETNYGPGLWVIGTLEVELGGLVAGFENIKKDSFPAPYDTFTGTITGWPPSASAIAEIIANMAADASWAEINTVNTLIKAASEAPNNIDVFVGIVKGKITNNGGAGIAELVKASELASKASTSSVSEETLSVTLNYLFSEVTGGALTITAPAGLTITNTTVNGSTATTATVTYVVGNNHTTVTATLNYNPAAQYNITFASDLGADKLIIAVDGSVSVEIEASGSLTANIGHTVITSEQSNKVTVTSDVVAITGFTAVSKIYTVIVRLDNDPVILRNFDREAGEATVPSSNGMLKSIPAVMNGDSVQLHYPANFDIAKYNRVRYTVFNSQAGVQSTATTGYHISISFFNPWDNFAVTTSVPQTTPTVNNGTVWVIASDSSSAAPLAANAVSARNGLEVSIPTGLAAPAGFRAQRRNTTTTASIVDGLRVVQIEFYNTSNPPVYTASKVTFDPTDGTGGPEDITVAAGRLYIETIPAASTNPTNSEGRAFLGWFTEEAGEGLPLTVWTPIFEDTTFYANWAPPPQLGQFTVTFNVNHTDAAGAVPPNPLSATTAAGKLTALPTVPTRSEGWGAGMTFVEWNTQADGSGTKVDTNTTFTEDTTIYAKWSFATGTPNTVGNELIIIAPAYETNNDGDPTQGTWHANNKINSDGSVFFSGDAVRYGGGAIRFMWDELDVDDYDFVVLSFVGERPSGTTTWMSFLNKKGRGAVDFTSTPVSGTGSGGTNLAATGTVRFALKNARYSNVSGYDSGIALQRNGNAEPPAGIGGTIKFTRAVFSKGTRFDITFDVGYPEGEAIDTMKAVSGVAIGPLPTPQAREGFVFGGWKNATGGAAVNEDTVMTAADLALEASWIEFKQAEPINVFFEDSIMGTQGGATWTVLEDGSGYEYSTNGTTYSSLAKFKVTLPDGIVLSDYDKIAFTISPVSGDTNYKSMNVQGGKPISSYGNPNSAHATHVTTYTGSPQNLTDAWPNNIVFTIDKSKALTNTTLTGEIELGVVVHCGAATFRITNFRIYQNE